MARWKLLCKARQIITCLRCKVQHKCTSEFVIYLFATSNCIGFHPPRRSNELQIQKTFDVLDILLYWLRDTSFKLRLDRVSGWELQSNFWVCTLEGLMKTLISFTRLLNNFKTSHVIYIAYSYLKMKWMKISKLQKHDIVMDHEKRSYDS